MERLFPRGPDGSSFLVANEGEFPFWLGFTRLAILDPTPRSDQPMLDKTNRYVLVFNGEIYNFIELRRDLENVGYEFRTESDTEVLLNGLIEFGPRFQERCNGMWSFCFYDRLAHKAILARDRFGKKPLFWTRQGRGLIFASEMKALTPFMSRVEPSPKIDSMLSSIFDYESSTDCVIAGINRIPPGHYGTWQSGQIELTRWWCTLDHLRDPPSRYEDQVEEFRHIFFDSVALRMRSDVKLGTALSGGLDSSSVFVTMSEIARTRSSFERLATNWQNAYCSSFPGSSNDETAWAQRVANQIRVPLQQIVTNPSTSFWNLRKSVWQTEDPYLTPPMPHLEVYRAMAQDGVKVTVDGHGADELFSGYGHLAAGISPLRVGASQDIVRVLQGMSMGTASTGLSEMRNNLSILATALARKAKWSLVNPPEFEDATHPAFRKLSPLGKKLYELFHYTILPTLLRNYDRYSMANGVEIRMPFMDHRLVTYSFSLPDNAKFGEGYSKRVVRDAMKGFLDESVRTRRQKVGWNAPVQDWLRGALRSEIQEVSLIGSLKRKDQESLKRFLSQSSPTYKEGEKIYRMLLPSIWRAAVFSE